MKQLITVIGIIAVGAVIYVVALKLKKDPPKVETTHERLLVQTTTVSHTPARLSGRGFTGPRRNPCC